MQFLTQIQCCVCQYVRAKYCNALDKPVVSTHKTCDAETIRFAHRNTCNRVQRNSGKEVNNALLGLRYTNFDNLKNTP